MHETYLNTKVEVFVGQEVREARADGGGKLASAAQDKARDFTQLFIHKSTLLSTDKRNLPLVYHATTVETIHPPKCPDNGSKVA